MRFKLSVFISTPLFAIAGRAGGMIIPFFVAYLYGVSQYTDAFFFSYAFIFFAGALLQQIFESVMVPYLAEEKKIEAGRDTRLAFHTAKWLAPCLAAGILLLGGGMYLGLSRVSGFPSETAALTARIFMEMAPFLIVAVFASAANGIFNTHKIFWYPAISPLVRSVVVVGVILLFHEILGIHALSVGFFAGEFLRFAVSLYLLKRYRLWGEKSGSSKELSKPKVFWSETGIQIAALAGIQMTPVVNQWFATWLGQGETSLFNYADRLFMIPMQIFLAGISQIFLSKWSEAVLQKSPEDFRKQVLREMKVVFLFAASASLMMWFFRNEIVLLMYGYGDLPKEHVPRIAEVFGWLIVGFAPAALNILYLRILFVLRKSVMFGVFSWARLVAQSLFNMYLSAVMGIAGIALGTTLATVFAGVLTALYVEKTWRKKISA